MRAEALVHTAKPLDELVRRRLRQWPQRPPGAPRTSRQAGTWMRARPGEANLLGQPFLKFPGASTFRTIPDGLWLHFGPDPDDRWADILCIEACGSVQNLQDKRARFAPSTSSLLVVCPVRWLHEPAEPNDPTPRWHLIRMLRDEPHEPLVLPVRDVRVLYGLKARHYQSVARGQVPHPHEYFCPIEALTAERGQEDPALAALIGRASAAANFMVPA
ncbi:hypothetical protein [Falsiroseomonas oryzae]|uniref:hypothetical protein n=1 Tax=Falsiroseomonas oryzae TaxID=2766473 RepID=UPI0022EB2F61|nr:hypothetical protein [Roseomonas sp. MO-31]